MIYFVYVLYCIYCLLTVVNTIMAPFRGGLELRRIFLFSLVIFLVNYVHLLMCLGVPWCWPVLVSSIGRQNTQTNCNGIIGRIDVRECAKKCWTRVANWTKFILYLPPLMHAISVFHSILFAGALQCALLVK